MQALNDQCASGLQQLLARPGAPVDDVLFISVDRLGADVRVRRAGEYSVERLGFASVRPLACSTQHTVLRSGTQAPPIAMTISMTKLQQQASVQVAKRLPNVGQLQKGEMNAPEAEDQCPCAMSTLRSTYT